MGCRWYLLIFFVLVALSTNTSATEKKIVPPVLSLDEVLSTCLKFHPLLEATQTEADFARGELLSAQGAFDPLLKSEVGGYGQGYYSGTYNGTSVEIPLTYMGSRLIAGYRSSNGDFPIYEGQLETNQRGEMRVGIEVPLLRDRATDRRRIGIVRSELQTLVASTNIRQRRIDMARLARMVYWDWAVAQQKLNIVKKLVRVAEERDAQLRKRVDKGDLANIEHTDNIRAILQRKNQLAIAEQALRRAELELSLMLRDSEGAPRSVGGYRAQDLPTVLAALPEEGVTIAQAIEQRPEVQRFDAQRDQNKAELILNENQFLPRVDARAFSSRDYGTGSETREESELKFEVKVEVPLMLRTQQGKQVSLEAKQRELQLLKKNITQRIEVEVRDALVALRMAKERFNLVSQEINAAAALEAGERKKFELGDSNLIFVNIREQATADASMRRVEALQDFWKAHAQLAAVRADPIHY